MTPQRLTTSARVGQIRAAIVRVKQQRLYYQAVSADPSAETMRIETAKESFTAAIREFGWQCDNVEAVLDTLLPEGK